MNSMPRRRSAFCSRACIAAATFGLAACSIPSAGGQPPQRPQSATRLGIEGSRFTINGDPTFLMGMSYYAGLGASREAAARDLDELRDCGFNWIRVWATWRAFDRDVSAVDGQGRPRSEYLDQLIWLVDEGDRRGMVVDVTLSRGNGVSGPSRLSSLAEHRQAVQTITAALAGRANWYLDLGNERNIGDDRHVSMEDLAALRAAAKTASPSLLVTASHGGDVSREELDDYLSKAGVDFVSIHRPRHADSPAETQQRCQETLGWMRAAQRVVPLHYQEPFRRGYDPGGWEPPSEAFLADLDAAVAGGAAGWCLHNGNQKDHPEGKPRRSFDLSEAGLFEQLDGEERQVVQAIRERSQR